MSPKIRGQSKKLPGHMPGKIDAWLRHCLKLSSFSKMRVDLAVQVRMYVRLLATLEIIATAFTSFLWTGIYWMYHTHVYVCLQVLSKSVCHALLEIGGDVFSGTATFCQIMDRFFDCLNVINYSESYKKLKPFRMPYRSVNDFRFK